MFCFDTDVISALLRPAPPLELVRRVARTPETDQSITAITVAELLYGATRIGSDRLAAEIHRVAASAGAVWPFDTDAAEHYGDLRAQLEREGRRVGEPDLMIAAIALSRNLTLVTGNIRHFARVPGLRVEDWLAA